MRATMHLFSLLEQIVSSLGHTMPAKVTVEPPKDKKFGDLAVNLALVLAQQTKSKPRDLAEQLAQSLREASADIEKVEVAGPGFLNVTFTPSYWHTNILRVEDEGPGFGSSDIGAKHKVQVEFVSANPTGPLHIGHGRGAAVGDSLVRIMRFAGYDVQAEYYLNDAGKQMQTLGLSIWLRAKELRAPYSLPFPEDCYQGDYISSIAERLLSLEPELLQLPEADGVDRCYQYGMNEILHGIKTDLAQFGVQFDVWFSEKSLVQDGTVGRTLQDLIKRGLAFEEEGALWFDTLSLGDTKNRVLKKSDGTYTYFASDIAYHANKYQRGFDTVIDVWGADHHGYVARLRACIAVMGRNPEDFDVLLVQFVNLLRDGQQIAMSTRAGQFETLADVIKEVGVDAARFMFLSRKSDSKLDFDLSLVKQRTMDNPVYYVQYAHARVQTLLRRAAEKGLSPNAGGGLHHLTADEELELLRLIERFAQVVKDAARQHAPHFISFYLMELAGLLHKYYAMHPVLGLDNPEFVNARLRLVRAVGTVIKNGLALLGLNAPETM